MFPVDHHSRIENENKSDYKRDKQVRKASSRKDCKVDGKTIKDGGRRVKRKIKKVERAE